MTQASNDSSLKELWYTRCSVPTPLGVASQLGWITDEFKADGITIKTLQDSTDPALLESHYDHHIANSFRYGGNVPAIWARSRGRQTRVIGLNWVDEYQAILVKPGSDIREPKDLKGKRLALPRHEEDSIDHRRASTLRAFEAALQVGRLAESDVTFVEFVGRPREGQRLVRAQPGRHEFGPVLEALNEGTVDVIFIKGSRGAQIAAEHNLQLVYDFGKHPDPLVRASNAAPRTLTVDQGLLDHHPAIAERLLARVHDVGDWARAHPAETVSLIGKETGTADQWVRAAYGDLYQHQQTTLDEISVKGLQAFTDFLHRREFIPNAVNVREWIDARPLEQVLQRRASRNAA